MPANRQHIDGMCGSLYVYVYVYVYVCVRVCVCVLLSMYLHVHLYMYLYMCSAGLNSCIQLRQKCHGMCAPILYSRIYIHVYIVHTYSLYTFILVPRVPFCDRDAYVRRVHVHIHLYIHIHTYIHMYILGTLQVLSCDRSEHYKKYIHTHTHAHIHVSMHMFNYFMHTYKLGICMYVCMKVTCTHTFDEYPRIFLRDQKPRYHTYTHVVSTCKYSSMARNLCTCA